MKLNKIFAVALAVFAMTSCDETNVEDYPDFLGGVNTASGVTVSLPQTYSVREDASEFYVPVEVNGTANGKIQVTVQIKELSSTADGTEPAKQVEHFNVTSLSINIPEGEQEGGIEFTPVWLPGEINDDRVFQVEIVSALGATVGNKTCEVTINNIDDPYTALFGKWKFTSTRTNAAAEYTMTIAGPDSDSEYYGQELYAYGLRGYDYVFLPLNYEYDKETGEYTLSIQTATFATDYLINFGFNGIVVGMNVAADSGFGDDIPMTYTLDDSGLETIAMTDMNDGWCLAVMPYPELNSIAGYWGTWYGIKLTRQN